MLKRNYIGVIVLFSIYLFSNLSAQDTEDSVVISKRLISINNFEMIADASLRQIREFPKGTGLKYHYLCLPHIGGIVDDDTLVSSGGFTFEIYAPYEEIINRTQGHQEDTNTISEQDLISNAYDYIDNPYYVPENDFLRKGPHIPLNVKITANFYNWSYEYAKNIVFCNFVIKNTGHKKISKMYFAEQIYPQVGYDQSLAIAKDDLVGFLKEFYIPYGCGFSDTFNIAWVADNDGDPVNGEFVNKPTIYQGNPTKSATSVIGFFVLDKFKNIQQFKTSFNWWLWYNNTSWGPRGKLNYRDFRNGELGNPDGDRNLYYVMSSGEVDYDQIYTASILPNNPDWLYPDQENAENIADGTEQVASLLSIGPFDLPPGGTISIPFAYVGGENFHTDPNNIDNLPYFPENYYLNLDFSDIAKNAQWAKWIYDNPGVDTDGDGYFGEKMICVLDSALSDSGWVTTAADTFFYKGDGIPDWKAAGPPPPPKFWVEPMQYGFRIRFNGSLSETEKDIFTKLADFEGYNVYMGRDDRETSLSLVASFDKHNFDKFIYHPELGRYKVEDIPLTLDELYELYGENFEPLAYSRTSPYRLPGFPDSLFYFKEHSFNASAFGINTPVTKVYPEARDPRLVHPDSLTEDDYTSDSLFKFFEYELIVEDLLPTVEYFINVTAFDFGSPKSGLQALESSKSINVESGFPLGEHDYQDDKLNVYVYPNPYRIDATYRDEGYEGRGAESWPDFRVRAINFGNLPSKCTISIYSLDGDLVRRLQHNFSADDPQSHHDHWDLITRNTQMVVSGLYYWVVEADDGQTQMGKLVIIM